MSRSTSPRSKRNAPTHAVKSRRENEYDYNTAESDEEDSDSLSPAAMKRLGKKKFYVCDEFGSCKKIVWNRFPAGAAKKGASNGLVKILVYSPDKQKWYGYIGKKLKIKAKDITDHQRKFGMQYKTKVYRHALPACGGGVLAGKKQKKPLYDEEDADAEDVDDYDETPRAAKSRSPRASTARSPRAAPAGSRSPRASAARSPRAIAGSRSPRSRATGSPALRGKALKEYLANAGY